MTLTKPQEDLYKVLVSNLKHPLINPHGLSKYAIREIKNLYDLNKLIEDSPEKRVYGKLDINAELKKISKVIEKHPRIIPFHSELSKPLVNKNENHCRNLLRKIIRLEAAIGMEIDQKYEDIIEEAFAELYLELIDKKYVDQFITKKDIERIKRKRKQRAERTGYTKKLTIK